MPDKAGRPGNRRKIRTHGQKLSTYDDAIQDVEMVADALRLVVYALLPLGFDRRRQALRMACEQLSIKDIGTPGSGVSS